VTSRFTCGTGELSAADAGRAGGKAAALGELARAGLPVPRGYVVMVDAFGLHLDAVDPFGAVRRALGSLPADDLAGIASAAADMRARVTAAPLPLDVTAEITSGYAGLGAGPVAVRSSAQDIEWALLGDSPGHPALHADLADRIVLLQSRPETVWAARDRAPVAAPRAKPSDHVLARFRKAL
jgi:hypothetical protein